MGEHDACKPFAGPVDPIGGKEPRERRRDGGSGADEEPVAGIERDVRENAVVELVERAKAESAIDPAVDTDAFARFCIMLAMGALVMRTMQVEPPDGDAWHKLITRLLDAIGGNES